MLHYHGPADLKTLTAAVVCSSRQSAYPLGNHPWVVATVAAVRDCAARRMVLVTSEGMATWELALARAAVEGMPVIVVVPHHVDDVERYANDLKRRFHLSTDCIGIACPESTPTGRRDRLAVRDRTVLELADIVYPVSVRKGGNLAALIAASPARIESAFGVPYDVPRPVRHIPEPMRLHPDWIDGRWLVHFTRAARPPWPGSSEYDRYAALVASDGEYCQSARLTLLRILQSGCIIASGRHMRARRPVVAFTELATDGLGHLFRFRPRLSTTSVEPWGLAVPVAAARRIGIRPVRYGDEACYRSLTPDERPYFQSRGRTGEWCLENEWRHVGDLDVEAFFAQPMRVVVPTGGEAPAMAAETGLEVRPLFAM